MTLRLTHSSEWDIFHGNHENVFRSAQCNEKYRDGEKRHRQTLPLPVSGKVPVKKLQQYF